jgi:hypothetical protein
MAGACAQAAAEEAAGIKRMSAFGAIADIGHCIVPMNYDAIDPKRTLAGPKSRSAAVSGQVCYPFSRKHGSHYQ